MFRNVVAKELPYFIVSIVGSIYGFSCVYLLSISSAILDLLL